MKKTHLSFLLVGLFIVAAGSIYFLANDDSKYKNLEVGEQQYKAEYFPELEQALFREDSFVKSERHDNFLEGKEILSKEYPWIFKHYYLPKGEPSWNVINKRNKPVIVTLGLPNKGQKFQKALSDNEYTYGPIVKDDFISLGPLHSFRGDLRNKYYRLVEEETHYLAPIIKQDTGLDVAYLPFEKQTQDNYGNLLIHFIVTNSEDTEYKKYFEYKYYTTVRLHGMDKTSITFQKNIDKKFDYMVYFTPQTDRQIEGYLLPDHQNQIDLSFCYIFYNRDNEIPLSDDMFRSMIRECILRSLGVPNLMTDYEGIFSAWNDPNPKYGPNGPEKNKYNMRALIKDNIPKAEINLSNPIEVNDKDRNILRALYDPRVKAGMTPEEFRQVFEGAEL